MPGRIAADELKIVTRRHPAQAEIADLLFAFRVAKHVEIERHRPMPGTRRP